MEQIKAASPARGYMRRYGSDTGSWTTNDFVEAVYRSMGEKQGNESLLHRDTRRTALCIRRAPPAKRRAQLPRKPPRPSDLTGYWVAFVTEDWRFRMVTPRKGDYQAVPMTDQARKVADAWDPAADEAAGNQCKAYGAAAIMRAACALSYYLAGRQYAARRQRRRHADAALPFQLRSPPRWASGPGKVISTAQWQGPASLKVATTNLRSGYLRKNGVPYSENAAVTEYFDIAPLPSGGQVLLVTTVVDDPQYLRQPFTVSSQFKKEADGSKWDPTPCTAK